jgi:hypothetical protein
LQKLWVAIYHGENRVTILTIKLGRAAFWALLSQAHPVTLRRRLSQDGGDVSQRQDREEYRSRVETFFPTKKDNCSLKTVRSET